MIRRTIPIALLVLFFVPLFHAPATADPAKTMEQQIAALIGNDFVEQEAAAAALTATGPAAIEPLEKAFAAAKTDAVRARIQAVLSPLKQEVFIASAPEIVGKGLQRINDGKNLNDASVFFAIHHISANRALPGVKYLQLILEKHPTSAYARHAAYALLRIDRPAATRYLVQMLARNEIQAWPSGPYSDEEIKMAIPALKAAIKRLKTGPSAIQCARTLVEMGDPSGVPFLRSLCYVNNLSTITQAEHALIGLKLPLEPAGVAAILHLHQNVEMAAQLALHNSSPSREVADTFILYLEKDPLLSRDRNFGRVFQVLALSRDKRAVPYARAFLAQNGTQQRYSTFAAAMVLMVAGEEPAPGVLSRMYNNGSFRRYMYAAKQIREGQPVGYNIYNNGNVGNRPEYQWKTEQWINWIHGRPVVTGNTGNTNTVQREIQTLINEVWSSNQAVAKAAFVSLTTAPDASIPQLRPMVLGQTGYDSVRRTKLVEVLGAMKDGKGVDLLLEVLRGRSKYVRDAAIVELAKVGGHTLKPRLEAMLKQSDAKYPWAKEAIELTLKKLAGKTN